MSINWKTLGITREDFDALWNLPYGDFHYRLKKLKDINYREKFFPTKVWKITLIRKKEVTVVAESEEEARIKVLGGSDPFANATTHEQIKVERIY